MSQAYQTGKRVALVSIFVSAALAAIKIIVGWLAGSTSVVADGVEALAYRTVVIGTFLKGLDVRLLWKEAAYFLVYAALAFGLCAALFRKRTAA